MGAGVADLTVVLHLAVRTWVVLHVASLQLAVWTQGARRAAVFLLVVRAPLPIGCNGAYS